MLTISVWTSSRPLAVMVRLNHSLSGPMSNLNWVRWTPAFWSHTTSQLTAFSHKRNCLLGTTVGLVEAVASVLLVGAASATSGRVDTVSRHAIGVNLRVLMMVILKSDEIKLKIRQNAGYSKRLVAKKANVSWE